MGGRVIAGWDDLSDAEFHVLREACEESPLVAVLNGWVRNDDAPYWNRKEPYVPALVEATVTLLDAGLVEVWEEPEDGIGEGGLLFCDLARQAVADPTNWWRYDPDGNWDPAEDLTRFARYEAEPDERAWPRYALISTNAVDDLAAPTPGRTRSAIDLPDQELRETSRRNAALGAAWARAERQVLADPRQRIRCPVSDDADLDVVIRTLRLDEHAPGAHVLTGVVTLTCPACGARREIRRMAERRRT